MGIVWIIRQRLISQRLSAYRSSKRYSCISWFLIYVNDLPNVSDMLFTVMFADDTSMFVNGENLSTLETQLNSELKHVSTWLQVNKLSLNVD